MTNSVQCTSRATRNAVNIAASSICGVVMRSRDVLIPAFLVVIPIIPLPSCIATEVYTACFVLGVVLIAWTVRLWMLEKRMFDH